MPDPVLHHIKEDPQLFSATLNGQLSGRGHVRSLTRRLCRVMKTQSPQRPWRRYKCSEGPER